jgi:predicted dehydrogenase
MRLFQPHQYLSLDYERQTATAFTVAPGRQIGFEPLAVQKQEPLQRELADFFDCVRTRRTPRVSGEEATRALSVCLQILDKIRDHSEIVSSFLASETKP